MKRAVTDLFYTFCDWMHDCDFIATQQRSYSHYNQGLSALSKQPTCLFHRAEQEYWLTRDLDVTLQVKLLYTADNEKRLAIKVKKLNEDLLGAQSRVTAALRLSEEDQITIATLRKELERNWKQIDASHDKVCWLSSFSITLDMSMKRVKNCHWDVSMQHLHPALVIFPGINLSTIRCVWTAFAYIQILALRCLRGLGTLGSECVGLV